MLAIDVNPPANPVRARARAVSFTRVVTFPAIAMLALAAIFVASRAIFLDSDLPAWGVAQLQPIDEFYYSIPAFNLYHYGSMDHQVVPFIATDGAPLNLLETLFTWLSLLVFGNTYYGLRMGSVAAGLLVLLLMFAILRRQMRPAEGSDGRWLNVAVPLFFMTYLVADFSFNVAARAAEPTIFRLLGMCSVLYVASVWPGPSRRPALRSATLGFLAGAAFLYVYFYNAFLVPAVIAAVFFEHYERGLFRAALHAFLAGVGAAIALASYAAVVWVTYHQTLLQLYQDNFKPFGGRLGSAGLNGSLVAIFSTNIFRFDIPLLVAFAVALPVFAYRVYRERSAFGYLVSALLLFLIVQSVFVTDYPYRKLLMLSPLVVIVIALAIGYVRPFMAALGDHRVAIVATFLWVTLSEYWIYHVYQLERDALGGTFRDLTIACVALLVATLAIGYVARGRMYRVLVTAAMAAIIVPGIFVSYKELYVRPSYHYRDSMIAAAPLLDHKVTAGAFSLAFRLYNDSVPVLNPYQYDYRAGGPLEYSQAMKRLFDEGLASFVVIDSNFAPASDLGLQQLALFEIDAEGTGAMAVYGRP